MTLIEFQFSKFQCSKCHLLHRFLWVMACDYIDFPDLQPLTTSIFLILNLDYIDFVVLNLDYIDFPDPEPWLHRFSWSCTLTTSIFLTLNPWLHRFFWSWTLTTSIFLTLNPWLHRFSWSWTLTTSISWSWTLTTLIFPILNLDYIDFSNPEPWLHRFSWLRTVTTSIFLI